MNKLGRRLLHVAAQECEQAANGAGEIKFMDYALAYTKAVDRPSSLLKLAFDDYDQAMTEKGRAAALRKILERHHE